MTDYRQQLLALAGALRVMPPDRFSWFGERSNVTPQETRKAIDSATTRHYLVAGIRAFLYGRFYLPGHPVPLSEEGVSQTAAAGSPFIDALIQANAGNGCWQPGWSIVERANGGVWVERDGLTVFASQEGYRKSSGSPDTSRHVCVRVPKGSTASSPGFYLTQSDAPSQLVPGDVLVRLYWHLIAGGAAPLMSFVTGTLNADQVPFQLKVLYDPRSYKRNDAGVLYIAKSDLLRVAPHLERIYGAIRSELMPGEPAFTKRLAPGLGLAEDPGDGESFGMHRCRILADAFVSAAEREITTRAAILELIEERFQDQRLDLDHPYLSPGSVDDYDDIVAQRRWNVTGADYSTLARSSARTGDDTPETLRSSFLDAARQIGDRLVASAFRHDGRCTWLGELAPGQPSRTPDVGALGPEVYSGTAGIALFLAHLYAETNDEGYAETSLAAISQSIHQLARQAGSMPIGYYTGWSGIAAVAAQVGRLIGDDHLATEVPGILFNNPPNPPTRPEPDVMAGTAGGVLAFLTLSRMTGDERYLQRAVRLGGSLISTARQRGSTMCWPVSLSTGRRALAGFAHGAAGIATALLELFAATGDERFATAARAAFAFERRNFSPSRANWIDLRFPAVGSRFGPAAITGSFWCHGSAGICISRVLAWHILGDEEYRAEAATAIGTTCRWLESEPLNLPEHWTLCHGFSGNADILLVASNLLSAEAPRLRHLAYNVGAAALASNALPSQPGLMLGQAGLGLFYLRLANSAVRSPLTAGIASIPLAAG